MPSANFLTKFLDNGPLSNLWKGSTVLWHGGERDRLSALPSPERVGVAAVRDTRGFLNWSSLLERPLMGLGVRTAERPCCGAGAV